MSKFLPSQSMSVNRWIGLCMSAFLLLLLRLIMVMAWYVRKARPAPATPAIQKNMLPSMCISHSLLLRPETSDVPVTIETRSDKEHRGLRGRILNNCIILLRRS